MTGAAQSSGNAPPDEPQAAPTAPVAGGDVNATRPTNAEPPRGASDSGVSSRPSLCDSAGLFVRKRLADLVDLGMALLIIGCVAVAVLNRSFMLTDKVLAGSIIAAALCFLLASRSLRRCDGIGYERMFVAACAMAGGIWLFELFSHLGWPESWNVLGRSLTTFGLDLPRRGSPFPVMWAVLVFATVFVGARHMRVNRWFWIVGAMSAAGFLLWIAAGFPHHDDPRRWPEPSLMFQLIPPEYAHPRDPSHPGWAVVAGRGALFATIVKLSIGVLPATLFMHHLGRAKAGDPAPPDDILARAWRSLESRLSRGAPAHPPDGRARFGRLAGALSVLAAPVRRSLRQALAFLSPKLPGIAELAMVGVILVSASLAILKQSFLLNEGLLAGSLIGFALCFLIVSRSLRSRKELGHERAFISLCAMVSSMWLFEIVFHYWGWNGYRRFWAGFPTFNLSAPWEPFPLLWALIMVSLVLVGAPYIRLNRYFVIALAIAVGLFWMWKAAGFPTFKSPELWPQSVPLLPLIPLEYARAPTQEATDTIRFWGGFFNTAAKVAWCLLPGTLFLSRENLGGPIRERVWPLRPALKTLFMTWVEWRAPSGSAENRLSDDTSFANTRAPLKHRTFCDWLAEFVHTKLADSFDLLAVAVLVLVIVLAAARPSFFLSGTVLAASVVAPALCYLLASRALRRCEGIGAERIFVAAAAMVAGIWLFETVAFYGWPDKWAQIGRSLTHFNPNVQPSLGLFPLLWAATMVGVMFVGAPYMRVNRLFVIALIAAISVFALWMAVGYPSHILPARSPSQTEIIQLIPAGYEHPRNPTDPGWAFIILWGSGFATATKILICVLPGLLFVHHLVANRSASAQPDDLLAKARRAVSERAWPGRQGNAPPAEATRLEANETRAPKRKARLIQAATPLAAVKRRLADRLRAFPPGTGSRIADLADLAMVGIIIAAVATSVVRRSFVAVPPQLLSASVIGYGLAFLLTSRSLRSRKELGVRRLFISLCAMASSVWLFEIVWHHWGFDVWHRAPAGLFTLSLNTTAQPFPLTWGLTVVGLVFTGARYMGPNRWIVVAIVAAVITFEIWKAAGWPLFPLPERWPQRPPRLDIIPPEYFHPDTPEERAVVVFWGALLNSITKMFWCVIPGTLFLTRENLGAPLRRILWPPGPALRGLFLPWTQWRTPSGPAEIRPAAAATTPARAAAGWRRRDHHRSRAS